MRWQIFLADFDFEVRHVPRKVNAAADAFSRKECHRANGILMLETKWPKVLAIAYKDDRITQEWQRNGDLTRGFAYHHETDGQTEKLSLVLEEYVRHFMSADQKDWPHHMTMVEFRYNSTKHSAIGFAPFLLATGRVPRVSAWFVNPNTWWTESKVLAMDDFI
ncbi:unnamed protein product [Calypogeia fissa]